MKILVIGGDGFCGWPTVLELLAAGHTVSIVDNLSRRTIDYNLSISSLTPISSIEKRTKTANLFYNNRLNFYNINVATEYNKFVKLLCDNDFDTVIHFGEIRSAPFSMINADFASSTISNNVQATSNILNAIAFNNLDIHLVHLGSMGVYGYNDNYGEIPDGYINIIEERTQKTSNILYPTDPGSVYHMTKSMDQIMFQFYNKNWNLRITDLHQGIVWGTQTIETAKDISLINRFDYDGIYGTVLNRFVVEGALQRPITVHGTGGQERAFIHISDSTKCIRLAVENPPTTNKVRILNQVSEVKSLLELATIISKKTDVKLNFIDNPRKEKESNKLLVDAQGLKSLGFVPTLLDDKLVDEIFNIVHTYIGSVDIKSMDTTKIRW